MKNGKIKQAIFKCLLNYRIIFAYFMATMFFFMHYLVTTSEFVAVTNDRSSVNSINIPNDNLNSKKLLNFDANYELPKRLASSVFDGNVKPKRQRHRGRLNRLLNNRVVVNKLVIDEPTLADYNLKNESIYYSQILQDRILMSLLNRTNSRTENGIFVEAGAYDGETWSNTLHLERYHNWTGLLIEPSPENYHQLRSKNRKAYSINSCLCGGDYSLKSSFIEAGPFGTIAGASTESSTNRRLTCHPLVKILDEFYNRLNRSGDDSERLRIVDYLSLDIEGNERTVIETFPFETRYRFNFINIEYNQNREVYEWLKMHLGQFGYRETFVDDVWSQDVYLAHESVFKNDGFLLSKVSELNSNTI